MRLLSMLLVAAVLGTLAAKDLSAGEIVITDGRGDLTWFYDSTNDSWDTVFRAGGGVVASGLTNPYAGPPGGVGGSANDYSFSSLQVEISQLQTTLLGGVPYYTAGPSPTAGRPDLGFRTRLQEDDNGSPVSQFATDGFRLVLDWENSTKPAGAEFGLWQNDGFGNPLVIRYDTASDLLSSDWPSWGHSHWVWGFSAPGDYVLQFQFFGLDENEQIVSSMGTTSLSFHVVPEPSSLFLLGAGALAIVGSQFVRNRKTRS